MSGISSQFTSSTASTQDNLAATYATTAVGSRYETTPQTVTDGQLRGLQIDSTGRLVVIGPTADANTFINRPLGVGGIYRSTLPTYTDGQATIFHFSSKGRLLAQDDAIIAALPAVLGQTNMAGSLSVAIASNQSTLPVQLAAGTAIAGKFGIDQTTPGTTNAVQVIGTVPLPTGAALDSTVSAMSAKLPAALGQTTMAASMSVAIASNQSVLGTTQADLIITGPAAQTTGNNILASDSTTATDATNYRSISLQINSTASGGNIIFEQSNDGSTFTSIAMAFLTSIGANAPATTFALASATTWWQGPVNARYVRVRISSPATGGSVQVIAKLSQATHAPLAQIVQQTTAANMATTATQSGTWTVQPGNTANTTAWLVGSAGKAKANTPVFNDYSSTPVTTAAYVQLVASTTSACTAVEVFNQSGSSLYFATGAAASEVNQFVIPPGGNGLIPIAIASSTRISVKCVDVNVSAGSLIVNFWS